MNSKWWIAAMCAGLALGTVSHVAHAQQQEEEEEARRDRGQRTSPSRITANANARSRRAEQECVSGGGRVYTREDIERTGSVDVKDALRRLDPSVF